MKLTFLFTVSLLFLTQPCLAVWTESDFDFQGFVNSNERENFRSVRVERDAKKIGIKIEIKSHGQLPGEYDFRLANERTHKRAQELREFLMRYGFSVEPAGVAFKSDVEIILPVEQAEKAKTLLDLLYGYNPSEPFDPPTILDTMKRRVDGEKRPAQNTGSTGNPAVGKWKEEENSSFIRFQNTIVTQNMSSIGIDHYQGIEIRIDLKNHGKLSGEKDFGPSNLRTEKRAQELRDVLKPRGFPVAEASYPKDTVSVRFPKDQPEKAKTLLNFLNTYYPNEPIGPSEVLETMKRRVAGELRPPKKTEVFNFSEVTELSRAGVQLEAAAEFKNLFPDAKTTEMIELKEYLIKACLLKKSHPEITKEQVRELVAFKVNPGEIGVFKVSFPKSTIPEFLVMLGAGITLDQALLAKQVSPDITPEEMVSIWLNGVLLKDAVGFMKAYSLTSVSKFIELNPKFDFASATELKTLIPESTAQDMMDLHKSRVRLTEAITYKNAFVGATVHDLIEMGEQGVTPNSVLEFKRAFPEGTIQDVIEMRKARVDFGRVSLFKKDHPKGTIADFIEAKKNDAIISGISYYIANYKLEKVEEELRLTGIDINYKTIDGNTLLDFALKIGVQWAEFFVRHGAIVSDLQRLKYPDVFNKIGKPYVPSEEAKIFTHLYILNKEAREAQLANAPDMNQKVKALEAATSNLGVEFQSKREDIIRKPRTINGVEAIFYYRSPEFYQDKNRPILVYTHGDGADNKMDTNRFDPLLDYYIAQGYVVVAPNFSAKNAIEDVYQVGMGVREIKDLEIDPDQVFLTSISAGSYLNFKMLEKIGQEKRINPFSAVQLVSSRADPNFKDRVKDLPHDIPYLIVHGEQDDVAPVQYMKDVYQAMVDQKFHVSAYFSPTGNHHMVDVGRTISPTTSESAPIYKDLAQWPEHFIPFFENARKSASYTDQGLAEVEKLLYRQSLRSDQEKVKNLQFNAKEIPSLKYVAAFNSGGANPNSSKKESVKERLETYFKILDSIEVGNQWQEFYNDHVINDPEIMSQIKEILLQEQNFFQSKVPFNVDDPENKKLRKPEAESGVVAYHGTNGSVVGLYHLYSAFEALRKGTKIRLATFRGKTSVLEELNSDSPLQLLAQTVEASTGVKALNSSQKYSDVTLSLNPTLFSGNRPSSNSLSLWAKSSVGMKQVDLGQLVTDYLSGLQLPPERIEKYKELLSETANMENGGIFQFFAPANGFDQISQLTEPVGARLSFPLSVSEYERLLREDPVKLKSTFAAAQYYNNDRWAIFGNAKERNRLFSIAQIRIPASAQHTQHLRVNFFSHHTRVFRTFLKRLNAMVMEDASLFKRPDFDAACGPPQFAVVPASNVTPVQKIIARISEQSGRPDLFVAAHRLVLQKNPRALRKFMEKNRESLGSNEEILFRSGDITRTIQTEYKDNPKLKELMLDAIQ